MVSPGLISRGPHRFDLKMHFLMLPIMMMGFGGVDDGLVPSPR